MILCSALLPQVISKYAIKQILIGDTMGREKRQTCVDAVQRLEAASRYSENDVQGMFLQQSWSDFPRFHGVLCIPDINRVAR